MISCTNRDDLHKFFPIPAVSFQTSGMQHGVVIRFKTFYLKIYDDESKYAYIVKGYRYGEINPVFEENVSVTKFRRFASQFTRDDYLYGFQHPHCNRSCMDYPCH